CAPVCESFPDQVLLESMRPSAEGLAQRAVELNDRRVGGFWDEQDALRVEPADDLPAGASLRAGTRSDRAAQPGRWSPTSTGPGDKAGWTSRSRRQRLGASRARSAPSSRDPDTRSAEGPIWRRARAKLSFHMP